jgi:hypothetical protein
VRRWLPWLLGVVVAVAVMGPALGPGSLLNLDLVLTPDLPVPAGVWGLGPELPRRVPLFVPMAWLGAVLDGALVGKLVMAATVTVAFAGAHRLAAGAAPVARVAAGLVYAAGPFLATRLAVGHLGIAVPAAALPWALPTLLRPADSLRRTLLWSAVLGFGGVNGGILAAFALLVGLVSDRGRRAGGVVLAGLIGQLPWLVPGVVVMTQSVRPATSAPFDTHLDGPLGLLRLTAGQGFWIPDFDVGDGRLVVPIAGAVLLALAAAGHRYLPAAWRGRALAMALVGLAVAAASGLPGVDGLYRDVADTALGAPLREGHRVLPLFLVWLAPAAALGANRLGEERDTAALVSLGAALALVGSSLWGFGGQLEPVSLPSEWADARRVVVDEPGPVLALPWGQYLRPSVIDGGLVHNPVPFAFGGDVLIPSGRGEDDGPDERADPRAETAGVAADLLAAGEPAGPALAVLGVRWVAVVDTVGDPGRALDDPSLDLVVDGATLRLYEVVDAPPDAIDPIIGPLARAPGEEGRTWYRPGATGWLRGLEPAHTTDEGNLALSEAAGPVWYWPSLLVVGADVLTITAVVAAAHRRRTV